MSVAQPLKEESTLNLSTGLAWTPTTDFTVTLDYYHIKINDRILLGATFDGTSDPVVAKILTDSGLTTIAGVQFPTNALDTKTDGVDLTANWRLTTGPGTVDLNGQFNYTKNKITRIDDLPPILRGTNTIYTSLLDAVTINAIEANRPDSRFTLSTTYTQGRVQAVGRILHYGKFKDGSLDGIEPFGAKTIFDSEVGYRWENIKVALGARNLFNVYPDQVTVEANTNNGTFIYPGSSPFGYNGRFIYARTELLLAR